MKVHIAPINIVYDETGSDKEYFAFFDKDFRDKCLKQSVPDYISIISASGPTVEAALNNLLEEAKERKDCIINEYDSVIKMIEENQKNLPKEESRNYIRIEVFRANFFDFAGYIPYIAGIDGDYNPNWEIMNYRDESESATELSIKELIGKGENEKDALENLLTMVSKYRKSINECADIIEAEVKKKLEDYTEDQK